jgi:putative zinc finger protein
MICAYPLDAPVLADYWLGALSDAEQDKVEEHLFECDACGDHLREVIALGKGIRDVARQGDLLMVVPDEFLNHIREEGLRVREYAPPRGGSVQCTVSAEDDFLIGRLAADLGATGRLDLALCDRDGKEQMRLEDIPFRPDSGSVAFQQPIGYAKAAPSETLIARLVAFDPEGAEQTVGEYTFIHTRTIAGPPGW